MKTNSILSYEKGFEYEKWYVQGKRWNGIVTKRFNDSYYCVCDQFAKHRTCIHIYTVKRDRKEKPI